jgi:hypothetical protein
MALNNNTGAFDHRIMRKYTQKYQSHIARVRHKFTRVLCIYLCAGFRRDCL